MFAFSMDSGVRLGEGAVTQAAIYGRWDSSAAAPSTTGWTQDAWYSIYEGTDFADSVLVDVVGSVNQSSPCGTSSQPWAQLVGPKALANGTYNLTGTLWITLTNYNPNDSTDNGDGGAYS